MVTGRRFYSRKKKASETSLSSSSGSSTSGASSSTSSERAPSQKHFLSQARKASKALVHAASAAPSKSHSVRTLLEATSKLYELKVGEARLVPDTEDFNKLLMLVIAEVADNTQSAYMRSYPAPAGGASGLLEEKLASKKKFPKGSVQAKVAGPGIAALQRCATKYLETGGGRFLSALDLSSKQRRRRPPGKTLLLVFKDFHLYDSALRKTQRHLPAASLHGVSFHRDAEVYQCGVLRRHQRLASPPTVSKEKIEELRKLVKEVFRHAKQVGANLARCVAPRGSDEDFKASSKEQIEEALKGPGGLITQLRQVSIFLAAAEQTSKAERSLAKFLHEAVGELLQVAGLACEARLGKAACQKSASAPPATAPAKSPASSRAASSSGASSEHSSSLSSKASPRKHAPAAPKRASFLSKASSSSGSSGSRSSPKLSPSFLSRFSSLKLSPAKGSSSSSGSRSSASSAPKLSPSFLSRFSSLKLAPAEGGSSSSGSTPPSPSSSSSGSTPPSPSSSSSVLSELLQKKQKSSEAQARPVGTPLKAWPVAQAPSTPARRL
jgi:hypothetical protein